jgi:hypothetical protein
MKTTVPGVAMLRLKEVHKFKAHMRGESMLTCVETYGWQDPMSTLTVTSPYGIAYPSPSCVSFIIMASMNASVAACCSGLAVKRHSRSSIHPPAQLNCLLA